MTARKFQLPVPFGGPVCVIVPNFDYQDGGRRHLGFWKFEIFNGWDAQEGRTASACQILSKSLKQRRFFHFSRWRPSAILDFQNWELSTSGPIRRTNMRHRTKFREDWSNRSRDMADFRLSRWRSPPSWILEI